MSRPFRLDALRFSHFPFYETDHDLGTFDDVWKKMSFQTLHLNVSLNPFLNGTFTRPTFALQASVRHACLLVFCATRT